MRRALKPATNPNGYIAAAGTLATAGFAIYNAFRSHGVIDTNVIIAAVTAISALLARHVVTPVADPRDAAGHAIGHPVVSVQNPPGRTL
jgi:hypothetical protein